MSKFDLDKGESWHIQIQEDKLLRRFFQPKGTQNSHLSGQRTDEDDDKFITYKMKVLGYYIIWLSLLPHYQIHRSFSKSIFVFNFSLDLLFPCASNSKQAFFLNWETNMNINLFAFGNFREYTYKEKNEETEEGNKFNQVLIPN